ncbi:hypothetical protein ACUY4R_000841 [Kosakonia sp. BK9b]|uniref:hypothetical protein n=1 Tax=Kosakonia sp. TaxID=1916651 RepID=UPI00289A6D24|nr:hypothetical protein [Kosakonia sp.]
MTKGFLVSVSLLLAVSGIAQAQAPLSDHDFTVQLNQQTVALGQAWNDALSASLGETTYDGFVGEVPFGDASYKFYRHNFDGFDIYSANLWWDDQGKSVDSYIIGQITLHSPTLRTARGVGPGSTKEAIINSYGPGETDNSDGSEWISYSFNNKHLAFSVVSGKVDSININFDDD